MQRGAKYFSGHAQAGVEAADGGGLPGRPLCIGAEAIVHL